MVNRIAIMMLAVLAIASCISSRINAQSKLEGTWYFHVNRVWDGHSGNPGFPSLLLAESVYHTVSNGPEYRITISGTREQDYEISIDDPPIRGRQKITDTVRYVFDLPLGRFLIMHGKDGLEGELTIYGSGLPIIKSGRGTLTR